MDESSLLLLIFLLILYLYFCLFGFGFVWYFYCKAERIGIVGPVKKTGKNFFAGSVCCYGTER